MPLTAAQIDLYPTKADIVRRVRGCIRGLEYPPAAALALDHIGAPAIAEPDQV